jgi:hypothetical protein
MRLKLIGICLLCIIFGNQILLFGQENVLDSAQNNTRNKYHIKVYCHFITSLDNSKVQSKYLFGTFNNENETMDIGHISVSFSIEKAKSIHEIELSRIEFYRTNNSTHIYHSAGDTGQITSGQKASMFNLNIRYEYIRRIVNVKDRMEFLVAASAEPYFESFIILPKIYTSFTTKQLYLGSKFYFIPRAIYNISNKFYIDLNFPIELFNFYWVRSRIKNPTLPINLQRSNVFHSNFFNDIFRLRLGIGIKI